MKRPAKGRTNVTLIVNDGEAVTKIEIADCDPGAGMRILRAGVAEAQEPHPTPTPRTRGRK